MSVLDVADQILNELAKQGAPPAVIAKVREYRSAERAIEDAEHLPERARKMQAALNADTVEAGQQQLADLEADVLKVETANLDRHDEQQRARLAQANGHHHVDHARIAAARTIGELKVVMEEAFTTGDPIMTRETWAIVKPRMHDLMASETRRNIQPSRNSAFVAFNLLELRMRNLSTHAPDRTQISETGARRQRELREQILACWRCVGLDQDIQRAAVITATAPTTEPTMIVGRFFDQFGSSTK